MFIDVIEVFIKEFKELGVVIGIMFGEVEFLDEEID